jgi:hypothetical protein
METFIPYLLRKSKGMILSETQEGFFTARAQSSKEILIAEVKSNKFLAFLATFARTQRLRMLWRECRARLSGSKVFQNPSLPGTNR